MKTFYRTIINPRGKHQKNKGILRLHQIWKKKKKKKKLTNYKQASERK